jgi:hypothetical protein
MDGTHLFTFDDMISLERCEPFGRDVMGSAIETLLCWIICCAYHIVKVRVLNLKNLVKKIMKKSHNLNVNFLFIFGTLIA